MSEPYRTPGLVCPHCAAPLREFRDRYICDDCRGMLIEEADLTSACADLAGKAIALDVVREQPTTKPCPRCELALAAAEIRIDGLRPDAAVLRCARHGVWIPDGLMTALFARIGRRYHAGASAMPSLGHAPAIGAATDGLRISAWRDRPRRRSPTVTPINLYADRQLACPACRDAELRFQGDRWTCTACTGAFVQDAALVAMVQDITGAPWAMPASSGNAGDRACPVCATPMLVDQLAGVTIDRCAGHGTWFDPAELGNVLAHAAEPARHGIAGWLRAVFRGDTPRE